ncbi:MAG: FtsQ-type POTRA domain-containing protein [Desulfobacterota bacterium]|nr:FtsQ-type POTRA domain-containing protein [Thermodesulfobacteriota bacterium]
MALTRKNRIVKRKKSGSIYGSRMRLLCALIIFSAGAVSVPTLLWKTLCAASCFSIADIQVSGCSRLTKDEVMRWAGINTGDNIFSFSISTVTQRLESNPWIFRACVRRMLPDTVCVYLEERQPCARIRLDRMCLVDIRGEIFAPEGAEHERLPLLEGVSRADIADPDPACRKLLQSALELVMCLHERHQKDFSDVSISLDKVFGLTMQQGETSIFLGFDEFDRKLTLLQMITQDLSTKGMTAAAIHIATAQQAFVTVRDADHAPSAAPTKKVRG